ncbi:hypothetical protein F2Q68_00020964 [Brassica cretica]|uniref:UBX domain-containing protein n=1 Tax=Brassica cretica TaxID=69181 RepID=A0A8S9FRT1_BRACR|nr:hypothetical protein F2Q68_00020964 [Brassica cretica]
MIFASVQEHRGDLNQAINAYFIEGDRKAVREAPVNVPEDDAMDIDDDVIPPAAQSPLSLLNAAGGPFSLLDSDFATSIFDRDPLMPRPTSFVSHPREVRQIPIEVKDSTGPSERSRDAPTIEDVTETAHVIGPAAQGTVIIDEESDDDVPFAPTRRSRHAVPAPNNIQDYSEVEEEMIRAAIEASKMEAEGLNNPLPEERPSHMGDADDIAKAVTMSLKSAEEETLRNQGFKASTSEIGTSETAAAQGSESTQALNGRFELERQLKAKEASLPKEPQADEENAITLLVRMPDGTRHGRRFLRSDKLQSLFDFIDIARVVKPRTYRLVRPYPRHAFGDGESESTLNDLGLSSKQEALFLELI